MQIVPITSKLSVCLTLFLAGRGEEEDRDLKTSMRQEYFLVAEVMIACQHCYIGMYQGPYFCLKVNYSFKIFIDKSREKFVCSLDLYAARPQKILINPKTSLDFYKEHKYYLPPNLSTLSTTSVNEN